MELYNVKTMPLSNDSNRRMAQERFARGERLLLYMVVIKVK